MIGVVLKLVALAPTTWTLVRNAYSWAPPGPIKSETIGVGLSSHPLTSPPP